MFVQVYNDNSQPLPTASDFTVTDTQENVYTPIVPGPANHFAYHAGSVPGNGRVPELDTVAANGPTQGALLLFKIQTVSLDNRPLSSRSSTRPTRHRRPPPSSTSSSPALEL